MSCEEHANQMDLRAVGKRMSNVCDVALLNGMTSRASRPSDEVTVEIVSSCRSSGKHNHYIISYSDSQRSNNRVYAVR